MEKKMHIKQLIQNNSDEKMSKGAVSFWIIFLLMIAGWCLESIDQFLKEPNYFEIPETLYQSFYALLTYNIIGKIIPNQKKKSDNGEENAS
jgi:hypothetical protein